MSLDKSYEIFRLIILLSIGHSSGFNKLGAITDHSIEKSPYISRADARGDVLTPETLTLRDLRSSYDHIQSYLNLFFMLYYSSMGY